MPQNLRDKKFGRLVAVSWFRIQVAKGTRIMWRCRCRCGRRVTVEAQTLRDGRQISCGCYNQEKRTRHGMYKRREYQIWADMIARCQNSRHRSFKNYGGRGVSICTRWIRSFAAFFADMGPRPSPEHSLDRKDNDGNYEPSNCRWATRREQQSNRRGCNRVTWNGKTQTLYAWARELGMAPSTLRGRLRLGWPISDVLFRPSKKEGKPVPRRCHMCRKVFLAAWCERDVRRFCSRQCFYASLRRACGCRRMGMSRR